MTAGLIIQVLVSGLASGAAYGLTAIGFTTIYRLTGVLQFAHGDLAGGAAFLALAIAAGRAPVAQTTVSAAHAALAALAAIAIATGAGALLYVAIIRPFIKTRSATGWIGATLALALAIQGVLYVAFPRDASVFPDVLPFSGHAPISLGGGAVLPIRTITTLIVGVLIAAGASLLLDRTRYGKALSAIADEPLGAQMIGLPVDRLVAGGFALAGALAAIAGIVNAPLAGAAGPQSGAILGLKGVVAALFAGLGKPRRVFVWALGIGVGESIITSLHVPGFPSLALGPAWRDLAPLLLLLIVLAVRPGRIDREPVE